MSKKLQKTLENAQKYYTYHANAKHKRLINEAMLNEDVYTLKKYDFKQRMIEERVSSNVELRLSKVTPTYNNKDYDLLKRVK